MTKDQAVDVLQTLMPKDLKRQNRVDKNDALKLAINALSHEPSCDCVSRDAVMDTLIWYENGGRLDARETMALIDNLPRVQAENIHGEWLEHEWGEMYCDRCGYIVPEGMEEEAENWSFCPGCGAQMEDGE